MNFQNTKEFAISLDAQDELKSYKNDFYFPQHNNQNVIYFTGNSLGLQPKITKKDFLTMISETETAPSKPKEKQKEKERKGPFDVPKTRPKTAPKAMDDAETAETIVKPKTPTTKPTTPFSPKPGVKPAPKAGKGSVPTWLKWDNIGLNF